MSETAITELLEALKTDRKSKIRRFPDQALHAIEDNKIASRIKERFTEGRTLIGINSLEYSASTGVISIYFEFSRQGSVALKRDTILVILNAEMGVIGFIDPFDPDQPNPHGLKAKRPFVLERPSCTSTMSFSPEEMLPRTSARRTYMRSIPVYFPVGGPGDYGGGEDGGGGSDSTTCTYSSDVSTIVGQECKQFTGLVGLHCDAWGNYTVVDDTNADNVTDDSG
jgi:hypothetical protein